MNSTPTSAGKRIVILGAGFAGYHAAVELERTLARDPGVEVLLVAPQNFLVFTPMLHEVAAGSLAPGTIVIPVREALRRVQFLQAQATAIDFARRTVTVRHGLDPQTRALPFDHLLIAAGAQTRFPAGMRGRVHGMKTIHDALVLRDCLIALLERAEIEEDRVRRRALLTIVVAGGGFSGVETIGAIDDFLRQVERHYRRACAEPPRLVLVESSDRLLPDFDAKLGIYTAASLRAGGIRVRLSTRVAGFDGATVSLADADADDPGPPRQLHARTLIWTAGVAPAALLESLPLAKERGRIVVDETLAVPGLEGVWACGDSAAVPTAQGRSCPPTAQHALRQGRLAARNITAAVRGEPAGIRPYRYAMRGQFAAIGSRRAVATLFGIRVWGWLAWLMWHGVYLAMLPRLDRKLRVLMQWILAIWVPRDTMQLLTEQSVRSGRVEELLKSARAAESAPGAGHATSTERRPNPDDLRAAGR